MASSNEKSGRMKKKSGFSFGGLTYTPPLPEGVPAPPKGTRWEQTHILTGPGGKGVEGIVLEPVKE